MMRAELPFDRSLLVPEVTGLTLETLDEALAHANN
jgi:hypothetical protein